MKLKIPLYRLNEQTMPIYTLRTAYSHKYRRCWWPAEELRLHARWMKQENRTVYSENDENQFTVRRTKTPSIEFTCCRIKWIKCSLESTRIACTMGSSSNRWRQRKWTALCAGIMRTYIIIANEEEGYTQKPLTKVNKMMPFMWCWNWRTSTENCDEKF